jgi:hypothetical protein
MLIGASDSADSAIYRLTVSLASASLICPNTSTVRDLKAFSSRNVLRWEASGAVSSSISKSS